MRSLLAFGVGATFTSLLLLVPASHAARWAGLALSGPLAVLVAVPVVVLLAALLWPARWLTFWAFPAAHLPALAVEPRLTGEVVYGGGGGLAALGAVAAVGAAWFAVSLWNGGSPLRPPSDDRAVREGPLEVPGAHLLPAVALVTALACFAAFAVAALGRDARDAMAANVTLLVGVAAVWYAVGRVLVGRLGDVLLEQRARRRAFASLFIERRRTHIEVWLTGALLLLALISAALWYLL
jgi:hypothetical protein